MIRGMAWSWFGHSSLIHNEYAVSRAVSHMKMPAVREYAYIHTYITTFVRCLSKHDQSATKNIIQWNKQPQNRVNKMDINETLRPFWNWIMYMPPWYFLGGYSTVRVQKHKMIYPQYDFFQHEQWEERYQLKIAWVVQKQVWVCAPSLLERMRAPVRHISYGIRHKALSRTYAIFAYVRHNNKADSPVFGIPVLPHLNESSQLQMKLQYAWNQRTHPSLGFKTHGCGKKNDRRH